MTSNNVKVPGTASSKKKRVSNEVLKSQSKSRSESLKWVKSIRALPTNPNNNDNLKTEYIDVNLNNSRKLIGNISDLMETTDKSVKHNHEVNESLARLNNIKHELAWLNGL